MSEKSGKRLVSWRQYLETIAEKSKHFLMAATFGLVGLFLLLIVAACIVSTASAHNLVVFLCGIIATGFVGLLSGLSVWGAKILFVAGREIPMGIPITRQNSAHLPEIETLVRASDPPPSHQKDELLRSAQSGQETPAEELLRASGGQDRDG